MPRTKWRRCPFRPKWDIENQQTIRVDNMTEKQLPCINCITYAVCKNSYKESTAKTVVSLYSKCNLILNFVTQKIDRGGHYTYQKQSNYKKVIDFFGWSN